MRATRLPRMPKTGSRAFLARAQSPGKIHVDAGFAGDNAAQPWLVQPDTRCFPRNFLPDNDTKQPLRCFLSRRISGRNSRKRDSTLHPAPTFFRINSADVARGWTESPTKRTKDKWKDFGSCKSKLLVSYIFRPEFRSWNIRHIGEQGFSTYLSFQKNQFPSFVILRDLLFENLDFGISVISQITLSQFRF